MAKIESYFNCDLKKAVQVQVLSGNVFSMDNNGNRICVRIFNDGEKATVTGSVSGRCILADGSTVNVSGGLTTANGQSVAYVDIPQGCLLIPGTLKITVQLTDSGVITTLAAILTTVYQTKTDNVITPSQQIINDWNAAISSALGAQDAQISALSTALTAETNARQAADTAEATARQNADNDLKSAIDNIDSDFRAVDGYIENALDLNYIHKTFTGKGSFAPIIPFVAKEGDSITINISGAGLNTDSLTLYYWYHGSASHTNVGNITVGTDRTATLSGDIDAIEFYAAGSKINNGYPIVVTAKVNKDDKITVLQGKVNAIESDLAPVFNSETTYYYGQYVTRNDQLYMVNTAEHTGAWDNNHFLVVTVGSVLYQRYLDQLEIMVMTAGEFNASNSYVAGNYTVHNKKFCRFIVDHTGAWNSAHVVEVTVGEELEEINNKFNQIAEEKYTIIQPTITSLNSGYMNSYGEVSPSSSYYYCNKIDVSEGDIIYRDNSYAIRFVTAYSDDTVEPSKGSNTELTTYTVPVGINKIILTLSANSQDAAALAFSSVCVKHFYEGEYVINEEQRKEIAAETVERYDPRKKQAYVWEGDLAASETVDTGFAIAPKKGFRVGFHGTIDSAFDKVTLQIDASFNKINCIF